MPLKIMKRDGRFIPYDETKISDAIYKAAVAAASKENKQADYTVAAVLAKQVSDMLDQSYTDMSPSVEDIQEIVIRLLLKTGHAKTGKEYIVYREERNRIRHQKTDLMRTIHEITEASASQADIKRENANIDGNTAMGSMLQYGSAISKDYCLHTILPRHHAALHVDGAIHIHDMDFMPMGTLTCCQIELSKLFASGFSTGHGYLREPQDITSYAALAAIAIQSNQNDQHGGQSVPSFDYDMAIGVRKSFQRAYIENLKKACALLAQPLSAEQLSSYKTKIVNEHYPVMVKTFSGKEAEIAFLQSLLSVTEAQLKRIVSFAYDEALKEVNRKTYQAMEGFIHNLNTMHSRAGAQVPFSSINFGTDTSLEGRMVIRNVLLAIEAGLGNGETPIFPISIFKVKEGISYLPSDPNYDLFLLACQVSAKRLFPNFSFLDAPFNLQYYREGDPNTEVTYMGCRTRVIGNVCGEEVVGGRGNISFTSINLVRLGILHGITQNKTSNLDSFFKELQQLMQDVAAQLLFRYKIQCQKRVENFPFLMGQYVWLGSNALQPSDTLESVIKQGTLTVGFIGLAECLKALIGQHHGESAEAQALGLRIVTYMRETCDALMHQHQLNFSLIATPAEGLSGRFTRIDTQKFGVIEGVTDREYYTNSFHVPVYYPISAYQKIQLEAPYHALTNAGHISYVEVDGDPTTNPSAFVSLICAMKEAGIGYGSINHPVDFDPVCGFHGIIDGDTCPKCKRNEKESDIHFDRIRRITGYLVGTIERFNNAKLAEVRDRVKHA